MGAEFSPLQLIATFPGFPYIPFGRDSPSMNRDLRDVGDGAPGASVIEHYGKAGCGDDVQRSRTEGHRGVRPNSIGEFAGTLHPFASI